MIFPTKAFIQWILCICSFSGKSILNLKSTRTPEQIEQLSFGAIGAKITHEIFISARSIPNLKSTRTPEQIEQLSFGAIGAKIPL